MKQLRLIMITDGVQLHKVKTAGRLNSRVDKKTVGVTGGFYERNNRRTEVHDRRNGSATH